ncbi:recombinase family protein [Syntrophomonas palmitatica]|uniref:recombinase family protein n=1 Tax=Syntrophomonas palmitatica TaxID=402877 RepID=UPI0006D0C78A|nr:recombinase family protein [Syntrophomonas palmitatica]
MRIATYRRVSSEEQALHGFSLEAQKEACINKAKEMGATSILEFADEGETGKTLDRPGLEALRQAIADGLIDCVVILDPDRFSRKLSHQLLLTEEFEKAGVELVFINFEWVDSPEGRLFYSIRGAISEYEREKITERMKRGQVQKAKQGRPPIGVYHYGYDYDPTTETISINEREAKIVKYIYNSLIQGITPAAIAINLTNDSNVPTKKGKSFWHRQVVRQILMNPSYKGEWHYKDYIIPVPIIIEPELWEKAQKILQESLRTWNHKTKRQYLLSGLLVCSDCGQTMGGIYAKHWGRYYRGYTCRKSPSTSRFTGCYPQKIINAESLEKNVWEKFKNLFMNPDTLLEEVRKNLPKQNELEDELASIKQQLNDTEKGRESLIEAMSLGILELDDKTKKKLLDIKNRKEKLIQKQKNLQNSLLAFRHSAQNYTELYKTIAAVIDDIDNLDFEDKRSLIRSAISQIEIKGRVNSGNTIPGDLPGVNILMSIRVDDVLGFASNTSEIQKP